MEDDTARSSTTVQQRESDEAEEYVSFAAGESPRDWPEWKKWLLLAPIYFVDEAVSFGASGYSPAQKKFEALYNVSAEVGTLGLSLYVLGLAFGPMLNAPLSEVYGRRPMYIGSFFLFLIWIMATPLSPNLGGFLVFRFLAGLFSSVTIATLGGTIADLWEPRKTGYAMSIYIFAATSGSPLGYFLFSPVAQERGLNDVFWAILGVSGGFWVFMTIIQIYCGETRHDVLLRRKAARLNKGNKDETAVVSVSPEYRRLGWGEMFKIAITRPFRLLTTEPIIICMALYNGYLYGISYLFNSAFNLVFSAHGFNTFEVGLAFLGIATGIFIGVFTNIWQEKFYQRRCKQAGKVVPEARIALGMVTAFTLPVSLFWFAWTSFPSVHFMVPIVAAGLWGWSFYVLILASYTYTEDSYDTYSASALAGLGFVRNVAGAGFPLFGTQMYHKLGYEWASSLLGFLSILLIPITFTFYWKGPQIRARSPFAVSLYEHDSDYQVDIKQGEMSA